MQCLGLNLDRVSLDPVIEIRAHGDGAVVDVAALVCFKPRFVAGCDRLGRT